MIDRYLAIIFVREALYRSIRKQKSRGAAALIEKMLFPRITDSIAVYNAKWFVSGVVLGLLMSFWMPLMVMGIRYVGRYTLVESLITAYILMSMLIGVLLIMDLVHQVMATTRELRLVEPLYYLPVEKRVVEKALALSLLIGGGLSLLAGIGVATGIMVWYVLGTPLAVIILPAGFVTGFTMFYPVALYLYSRLAGRVPGFVSLVLYTLFVALLIVIYFNVVGLGGDIEALMNTISRLSTVYPVTYAYIVLRGATPAAALAAALYTLLGAAAVMIAPSRLRLTHGLTRGASYGKALILNYPRLAAVAMKDVLLLLRSNVRSKQFYGQLAAIYTPGLLPLFTGSGLSYMASVSPAARIILVSLYGLLTYIAAVIVVPNLLFAEGIYGVLNYYYPLSRRDLVVSKTIAGLLLVQPVFYVAAAPVLLSTGPVYAAAMYYAMTAYWVLGSLLALYIIVDTLSSEPTAWTEYSLGIVKRMAITLFALIPFIALGFVLIISYLINIYATLMIMLAMPAPATAYTLYLAARDQY